MDTRSAILARARDVISRSQIRPAGPIPCNYIRPGENPLGSKLVVGKMIGGLEDHPAEVIVTPKDTAILDVTDELLGEARSVVVPAGLPENYKRAVVRGGHTMVEDSHEKAIAILDLSETNAVLICSRMGISVPGTIVLGDEPNQGHRAISLVPDKYVVVLECEAIMPTVPQAVDVLGEHPTRPMTWIAGGPATNGIEPVRVNGVHGPRSLRVVIIH